jgi:hypothetical protein
VAPGDQASVFVRDDDDEEVAFANLAEADIDRPIRSGAEELHRIVSALDTANRVEDASRSCSRSSKVLQTNMVNGADIGFPP